MNVFLEAAARHRPLIPPAEGLIASQAPCIALKAMKMQQNAGAGLFFLSYAACEVPSNLLL